MYSSDNTSMIFDLIFLKNVSYCIREKLQRKPYKLAPLGPTYESVHMKNLCSLEPDACTRCPVSFKYNRVFKHANSYENIPKILTQEHMEQMQTTRPATPLLNSESDANGIDSVIVRSARTKGIDQKVHGQTSYWRVWWVNNVCHAGSTRYRTPAVSAIRPSNHSIPHQSISKSQLGDVQI